MWKSPWDSCVGTPQRETSVGQYWWFSPPAARRHRNRSWWRLYQQPIPPMMVSTEKRLKQKGDIRGRLNIAGRDSSQITERERILIKMNIKVVRIFEKNHPQQPSCFLDRITLTLLPTDLNKKVEDSVVVKEANTDERTIPTITPSAVTADSKSFAKNAEDVRPGRQNRSLLQHWRFQRKPKHVKYLFQITQTLVRVQVE